MTKAEQRIFFKLQKYEGIQRTFRKNELVFCFLKFSNFVPLRLQGRKICLTISLRKIAKITQGPA